MSALGSVYRFFNVEWKTLNAFKNETLYFSHVDDFNDPFEGRLGIAEPQFSYDRAQQVSSVARYFSDGHLENVPFNETNFRLAFTLCKKKFLDDLEPYLKSRTGVACFVSGHAHNEARRASDSERPELNRLMWSHYAKSLCGFCVEFDPVVLLDSLRSLTEGLTHDHFDVQCVTYSENRPTFDVMDCVERFAILGADKADVLEWLTDLTQIYFQKSSAWAYEKEVRFIGVDQARQCVKFSPAAIRSVLIGSRMESIQEEVVKDLFRSLGVSTFKRVSIAPDTYQLFSDDI
jgi:hypothetical protein